MDKSYYKKGCDMAKSIGLDVSDRSKRAPGGPLGGIMAGNQRRHEAQVHAMTDPKINAKVQKMTADQLLKTASQFGLGASDFGFDDASAKGYQFDKTPQTAEQMVTSGINKLTSLPPPQSQPSQPSVPQAYSSSYSPQQNNYSDYSNQYSSPQYDTSSYSNYYGYRNGGRVYKSEGGEMVKDMVTQQILPMAAGAAGEAVAGPVGGLAASVIASQLPSMLSSPSAHDTNMARFKNIFPKQAAKLQALQNQHAREQEAQPYIDQAKEQNDFINQVKTQDSAYQAQIQQLQQQLQNSQQQYNQPNYSPQNYYQDYSDYQDQGQQQDSDDQDYYSDYQY